MLTDIKPPALVGNEEISAIERMRVEEVAHSPVTAHQLLQDLCATLRDREFQLTLFRDAVRERHGNTAKAFAGISKWREAVNYLDRMQALEGRGRS